VKGMLNLALTHIVVPRHIPVVDSRVVSSLLELSHTIKFGR
jgi:NADH/NAD ratio-sensing transcriptional regulator Rex